MSQMDLTLQVLSKEIENIEKKAENLHYLKELAEKSLIMDNQTFSADDPKGMAKQKLLSIRAEQSRLIETFTKKQDVIVDKAKAIENLEDHIADIEKEVENLQKIHEEAMNELVERKEFMKMRIKSIQDMDILIANLEKELMASKSNYSNKILNLKGKREELLNRTDLSPTEMEEMLANLDKQIEDTEKDYLRQVKGITEQISNIKVDITSDPNQLAARFAALEDKEQQLRQEMLTASPSRLLEIQKELQDIENQKKEIETLHELAQMTAMDQLLELMTSKGLKLTDSGRILTPSGRILTLEDAKNKGLLDGLEDDMKRLGLKITSSGKIIFLPGIHEEEITDISEATTVSSIETSSSKLSTADTHYLKATVGKPLALALAEITALQPSDPIHYLAHWLFKYRYNQEVDDRKKNQLDELMREKEEIAKEAKHRLAEEEAKNTMYDLLGRVSDMLTQRQFETEMQRILEDTTNIESENQNAEDVPYNSPTSEQEI